MEAAPFAGTVYASIMAENDRLRTMVRSLIKGQLRARHALEIDDNKGGVATVPIPEGKSENDVVYQVMAVLVAEPDV